MAVIDGNTSQAELTVRGGGASPPGPDGPGGSGRGPESDRARLMLAIYNARRAGAASLEYLRRRTGFSRERLWRTFEDLEDAGYVEALAEDPRGPVVRWLDRRKIANVRVFASTFAALTEAGRHSPELAELVAEQDTIRGWRAPATKKPRTGESLRRLRSRLTDMPAESTKMVAREWRNRDALENPHSRRGGLNYSTHHPAVPVRDQPTPAKTTTREARARLSDTRLVPRASPAIHLAIEYLCPMGETREPWEGVSRAS